MRSRHSPRHLHCVRVFLIGVAGGIGSVVARPLHGAHSEPGVAHLAGDACSFDMSEHAVQRFVSVNGIVNCAEPLPLKLAHRSSEGEWRCSSDLGAASAFATAFARAASANQEAAAPAREVVHVKTPDEVASAGACPVSSANFRITGPVIGLDGGFATRWPG